MTNQKPPESRVDHLLKAQKLIKEYIQAHLDELVKLQNGSVIVQAVCQELGILDSPILIEVAHTAWLDCVGADIRKKEAKERLRDDLRQKTQPPQPDRALEGPTVQQRNELIKLRTQEALEVESVFSEALERLVAKLEEPKASFWQRLKLLVRPK